MDSDVEEFLAALKPGTRKLYGFGLNSFEQFYGESPKVFIDRVEEDLRAPRQERKRIARNALNGFINHLTEKGYAPKTIRAYVAAVQSMASYYEVAFTTKYTRLPSANPVSKKEPWILQRVVEFVKILKPPHQAIAVIVFQSGLGLGDLLALRWDDIKAEFETETVPLCFDLGRIKTDVPFMTFIGKWGFHMLKTHLAGVKLRDEDHLFQIGERAVEEHFQRIAKRFLGSYTGKNPMRPHSLRAGFKTLLSDHKVDPLYSEFWMGHQLAEQQKVYLSKSRDGWRKTYLEQAEPWLTPKKW